MIDRRSIGRASLALALLVVGRIAFAQTPAPSCDYRRCALTIIPRLTALDVVRGDDEQRVASLAFLFPRPVTNAFQGNDVARRHAERAFSQRRLGAMLTDLVGAALLAGVARAAAPQDHRRASVGLAFGGAALFAISVPIHFSADAELSRAAREFNRHFVR
jgi:hypothetical protein